jgi:hypothetical protein
VFVVQRFGCEVDKAGYIHVYICSGVELKAVTRDQEEGRWGAPVVEGAA